MVGPFPGLAPNIAIRSLTFCKDRLHLTLDLSQALYNVFTIVHMLQVANCPTCYAQTSNGIAA